MAVPFLNQKILNASSRYLGVKELPGEDNEKTIVQWLSNVGLEGHTELTAWCAAAMNGILMDCEIEGTGSALARSFLKWGTSSKFDPMPGDLVVLKRGQAWQGHVGIFIKISTDGRAILLRGGNQKNAYCEVWYSIDAVIDYRRAV